MKEIESHVPMVQSIVNQFYVPDGLERDDLVQAGLIGIWKATKKYKENNKTQFSTYAYVAARNEILDLLRKQTKFGDEYTDVKPYHADSYSMEREVLQRFIIEDLEEHEKQLCELLYDGYTQREIAKMFGTTQPNICQRIRKIRIKAKRKWGENWNDSN